MSMEWTSSHEIRSIWYFQINLMDIHNAVSQPRKDNNSLQASLYEILIHTVLILCFVHNFLKSN